MNGSPWMNWQQFAEMNETETQRAADERRQQQEQEQKQYEAAMTQLSQQAQEAGQSGSFSDVTKLGGYKQVMEQQRKAMEAANRPQVAGAAWESFLSQPGAAYRSPWEDLASRLGQINQYGARAKGAYDRTAAQGKAALPEARRRQFQQAQAVEAQQRRAAQQAAAAAEPQAPESTTGSRGTERGQRGRYSNDY